MNHSPNIQQVLESFEKQLLPAEFISGFFGASVIGYGEISSVLALQDLPGLALKRMPLFTSRDEAEQYILIYHDYCRLLKEAGIVLPEDSTFILEIPGRPVVLYLQQRVFASEKFVHHLIRQWSEDHIRIVFERILNHIQLVWHFSENRAPGLRIALDAQLSNWVVEGDAGNGVIYYVDTSTPLYQIEGREQLNPELFLKSAMPGLRWVIRKFFITNVINRYYDKRSVLIDLTANLYKEQCPHLIPIMLKLANGLPGLSHTPIYADEVKSYYNEDRRIWEIVQFSRKLHRWGVTKLKRGRYEFILPGTIHR